MAEKIVCSIASGRRPRPCLPVGISTDHALRAKTEASQHLGHSTCLAAFDLSGALFFRDTFFSGVALRSP